MTPSPSRLVTFTVTCRNFGGQLFEPLEKMDHWPKMPGTGTKSGYLRVTLPAPLAEVPRVLNRFPNKKTNPLSRKHRLFGSLWEETGAFGVGVPALGTGPSTPIVRRLF